MKKFSLGTLITRLLLIFWSVVILIPFAMLFLTSTKTNEEFYAGIWTLPQHFFQSVAENYSTAWREANMGIGFINAIIISGAALALTLILGSMVSYAIARRKLRRENTLSTLFLLGLLIPAMVGLTPAFIMARAVGLFDTRLILILLYTSMELPFCVFLMTSFFRTIPHELEEAAYIDGASPWMTFFKIIVPLVRPAFVTAGIFAFLDFWSEYMYGLMFITDSNKVTVAMNILQFKTGTGVKVNWGVTTAACVIFVAPVLIVYCIAQKKLIGGLTAGSVKG